MTPRRREYLAEGLGTGLLLMVVVGSGAMVSGLGGSPSTALFAHAVVVGAGIAAIIVAVGPVSGAHLNPVVTLVEWRLGGLEGREVVGYVGAQLTGAVVGVAVGNLMFGLPVVAVSPTDRIGAGTVVAEVAATFGLVLVVFGAVRAGRASIVPFAVGAWVAAAIVATSSTGFANPAVTIAREFTDSYTGIAPVSAFWFLFGEAVGAGFGLLAVRVLHPHHPPPAGELLVPHDPEGE